MAGTFTPKNAAGQLASSKGNILTVAASTVAFVKTINLYNTSTTTTQTINLYKNVSGTSYQWKRIVLGPEQYAVIEESVVVTASDEIEADTTSATTVNYDIAYVEET